MERLCRWSVYAGGAYMQVDIRACLAALRFNNRTHRQVPPATCRSEVVLGWCHRQMPPGIFFMLPGMLYGVAKPQRNSAMATNHMKKDQTLASQIMMWTCLTIWNQDKDHINKWICALPRGFSTGLYYGALLRGFTTGLYSRSQLWGPWVYEIKVDQYFITPWYL